MQVTGGRDLADPNGWREACRDGAYSLIRWFYGDRVAVRSGVPYMQHIDDGLAILVELGASQEARDAFCLHPIVQGDQDLASNLRHLCEDTDIPAYTVALAVEYRSVANEFLSPKESHPGYDDPAAIRLSPLPEVNAMLLADKRQNYKDFKLHHDGTHPRSDRLHRYFQAWLARLESS
jgi:hypothetical protein